MKGPFENIKRKQWTCNSWKDYHISQQPNYEDVIYFWSAPNRKLQRNPNAKGEIGIGIILIITDIKKCSENKAFIIQVGDCAERFIDAKEEVIERQIIFFNTLSQILSYHLKKEVVTIGRIAGQYAKPRSQDYEIHNNKKIEIYRGDIINHFSPENRKPDPERMLEAYINSTITINQINNWNFYGDKSIKQFINIYKDNKYGLQSQNMRQTLLDYYDNFRSETHENFIFTSHEGLLLHYEECLLREINEKYFDLSSHFLWIGERTGNINEAHIEFFRGIENPIGIKVSSRTNLDELIGIIRLLNPENIKGKIVLITRFGCSQVEICLENLCNKIIEEQVEVIFICDPNHGNTKLLKHIDKKVRYFDDLLSEIVTSFTILKKYKFHLGGIHLEASSLNVTECIGGLDNDVVEIQHENYTTYCDPRLNMLQAYQMCDYVGKFLSSSNESSGDNFDGNAISHDNFEVESRILDM